MTGSRESDQERLLERIATGGLGASDPSVQALAAADPVFRKALMEMQDLQHRLDAAARVERDWLSRSGTGAAGGVPSDLVERTLGELARGSRSPAPRWRRHRFAVAVLAAAACVAIAWAFLASGPRVPVPDRTLGLRVEAREPEWRDGDVVLRWTSEPGATAVVWIYAADDPTKEPVGEPFEVTASEWQIPPQIEERLAPGRRWRWHVKVVLGGHEAHGDWELPRR